MLEIKTTRNILPVYVIDPQSDKEKELHIAEELESLIQTLGGVIVGRLIQRMDRPNQSTFIGRGKVEELSELVKKTESDVVVLNEMAKPGQIHTLKSKLQKENPDIEVWDRVDLILHIFDKHAKTTEAKLQIELARMRYMGPRIYGMGYVLSRQGGGIGTSGVGETNTELMKRHWRGEIKKVENQIEKISKNRENQLARRKREGYQTISIIGYTNAGKSSLFNLLSGKHVLTEDSLFATLDSSVGKMFFQNTRTEVLLTDTIGFIRDLPPHLIRAFKSTLLESVHADILLHVIDVSDPEMEEKIRVVEDIVEDLNVDTKEIIYVFNKIDANPTFDKNSISEKVIDKPSVFISVKEDVGIDTLRNLLEQHLSSPQGEKSGN
jgi:GTPase